MKSLILLLDGSAPSFCYYEPTGEASGAMARSVLEQALAYASSRQLALQVVAGHDGVDGELRAALPDASVCYVPVGSPALQPGDVPIVELEDWDRVEALRAGDHTIAILRVGREELSVWPQLWWALAQRVHRVVLVPRGLERYREGDLTEYRASLEVAGRYLEGEYFGGRMIELNVLSDRLVLDAPVECAAGVDHVTVAPTGELYICPGFAARGAPAIGRLPEDPAIPSAQLLLRERAPICSPCDAYHCRRCVDLNQRATLEVNTPPWQICRVSHLEREASRQLLERLHARGCMQGVAPLPALSYEDPFELLTGPPRPPVATPPAAASPPQPTVDKGAVARPERAPDVATYEVPGPNSSDHDDKEIPMEERTPVGRVSAEERDEIRELFLRKSALTELFLSLAKLDSEALEKSPLYDKVLRDMGEVTVSFQEWWEEKAKEHGWTGRPGGNWSIDFETCEIFLT